MQDALPAELAATAALAGRLAAQHYCRKYPSLAANEHEDFTSEGTYQALRAAAWFDASRGAQPLTFLFWHALGAIKHYHEKLSPGGRTRFRASRTAVRRVKAHTAKLEKALQAGDKEQVRLYRRLLTLAARDLPGPHDLRPLPLSLRRDWQDEPATLEESVECPRPGTEVVALGDLRAAALWEQVGAAVSDPRAVAILWQRFGEERSQREVAEGFGISQMQISRLERRALAELRAVLTAEV